MFVSCTSSEYTPKFAPIDNRILGTLTVPENWDSVIPLQKFKEQQLEEFSYFSDEVSDSNFNNPSHVLRPGDKFHVRAFKLVGDGTTTSKEVMNFLTNQNAIYLGAQGLSLVFEQMRYQLPKGMWYISFDEYEHLWIDDEYYRRLPVLGVQSGDISYMSLGFFENDLSSHHAFLCFTKIE